jgi:hypothetical protein
MSASEKTAAQVLLDELEPWGVLPDPALAGDIAAKVIAHLRPEIEAEYRKRYPTGFCDCACKMDAAGDNVLSLCNTHRDYVKQREAAARTAATADAASALRGDPNAVRFGYQHEERQSAASLVESIATAPSGHACVPVDAIESIKEDKIFPNSGFHEEYIRGYNEACAEHYDELRGYFQTRPK